MKNWDLLEAIGEAGETMAYEAEKPVVRRSGVRLLALAAEVMLALMGAFTALATVSEPANDLLYRIWPYAAQSLKPVRLSCEDQGIRMEVHSAAVAGNETLVTLSLQDLTGNRLDRTIDLFDSANLLLPYDGSGTCVLTGWDEDGRRADFGVYMQFDTDNISDGKATFQLSRILTGKRETTVDLTSLLPAPLAEAETVLPPREKIRGWSGNDAETAKPEALQVLDTAQSAEIPVTEGVYLSGAGFVDGELHVQLRYEDILHTDNHGFVQLVDADGTVYEQGMQEGESVSWFGKGGDSHQEYIFRNLPADLEGLRIVGEFVTAAPAIEGNWQVTFPLELAEE